MRVVKITGLIGSTDGTLFKKHGGLKYALKLVVVMRFRSMTCGMKCKFTMMFYSRITVFDSDQTLNYKVKLNTTIGK